jgi:DNA-binding NtrC family response regulator
MEKQTIQSSAQAPSPAALARTVGGAEASVRPLLYRPASRFERSERRLALVSSSDDVVQQTLADSAALFRLTVFRSFTLGETRRILSQYRVELIVCEDRLVDGGYEDVLDEANRLVLPAALIVISRTGDWPEYLKAMGLGAFDYLSYPLAFPDFGRTIRHALVSPAPLFEQTSDRGGQQ